VKLVVLIVGVLIAAAIAWDAGERHYDNCVTAAKASLSAVDRTLADVRGEQPDAIKGCSRLPW
jgi:hypothetical protein